jgi:SSS family solute:Na+ symporter
VQAFPALAAHVLPSFWQGVFTVGLLATIMSTVDSYAFICSVTLGRDLIGRWRTAAGDVISEEHSLPVIRWSLLATAVVAVVLALVSGSVIQLWKALGSVGTPVLFLPMMLAQIGRRVSGRRVVWSMGLAGGVSVAWLVLGAGGPWLGVEGIFPGLGVSAIVLLSGWRGTS